MTNVKQFITVWKINEHEHSGHGDDDGDWLL